MKFQALLGVEPRISCLLDRHFNQLSHSACNKQFFFFLTELSVSLLCTQKSELTEINQKLLGA